MDSFFSIFINIPNLSGVYAVVVEDKASLPAPGDLPEPAGPASDAVDQASMETDEQPSSSTSKPDPSAQPVSAIPDRSPDIPRPSSRQSQSPPANMAVSFHSFLSPGNFNFSSRVVVLGVDLQGADTVTVEPAEVCEAVLEEEEVTNDFDTEGDTETEDQITESGAPDSTPATHSDVTHEPSSQS